MKQFYILALAAAASLGAAAQPSLALSQKLAVPAQSAVVAPLKAASSRPGAHGVRINTTADGLVFKSLATPARRNTSIRLRPNTSNHAPASRAAAASFKESFEGATGDSLWLPDGWTRKTCGVENVESWNPGDAALTGSAPYDGDICMLAPFSMVAELDEWIITPAFTPEDGQQLTFGLMGVPFFYYSLDNFDWNTFEFVGERVVKGDIEVLASVDGGENWTQIYSMMGEVPADMSAEEVLEAYGYEFRTIAVDMSQFAGQSVKLAFRNSGLDTNLGAIDGIRVGFPSVSLSMARPSAQLYLGITRETDLMNLSLAYNGAYTDLTWENWSENAGASYGWIYIDPATNDFNGITDDVLTLNYPGNIDPANDNFVMAPTLAGWGDKYTNSELASADYLKAGGKPGLSNTAGELTNFGACAVDFATQGYMFPADAAGSPVFGYGPGVDQFWNSYSFGADADENNWAHVTQMMNIHISPETPMVINGGWVIAQLACKPAAKFTLEILPISEEGEIIEEPLAATTVTGLDYAETDITALDFTFDVPAVVSADVCPMYAIRISGFRDPENVSLFAPLTSRNGDPEGRYMGWINKEICYNGNVGTSLSTIGEYMGDTPVAYYIMLDADYNYIHSDLEEITLKADEEVAVPVVLHTGNAPLFVSGAPQWLCTDFSQLKDGKIVLLALGAKAGDTGEVTFSCLGASKTFKVTVIDAGGVTDITAGTSAPAEYYNLQGIRIEAPTAGQTCIVRRGTTATKVTF